MIDRFERRLRDEGVPGDPSLMTSTGDVIDRSTAAREPVRIIESGTAAGVLVNSMVGAVHGLEDVFSFDMGVPRRRGPW